MQLFEWCLHASARIYGLYVRGGPVYKGYKVLYDILEHLEDIKFQKQPVFLRG